MWEMWDYILDKFLRVLDKTNQIAEKAGVSGAIPSLSEGVLSGLRNAATAGLLHEDREAVEMEEVCDSIEHFGRHRHHVMIR